MNNQKPQSVDDLMNIFGMKPKPEKELTEQQKIGLELMKLGEKFNKPEK